jgi:hypothetical protein
MDVETTITFDGDAAFVKEGSDFYKNETEKERFMRRATGV